MHRRFEYSAQKMLRPTAEEAMVGYDGLVLASFWLVRVSPRPTNCDFLTRKKENMGLVTA
jgi:hypothetical protein